MRLFTTLFLFFVTTLLCGQSPPLASPLFTNSIVSTSIDFITADDPDAFEELQFLRQERKEMPDSRNGDLFDDNTFVFEANFTNGARIEIWCHSDFRSPTAARLVAEKVAARLGKLPALMLDQLSHVVVHNGDAGAFAESEAQFFVLYSDNMDIRISNNDLEETIFHESIHAVFDQFHLTNAEWMDAQAADVNFITDYAMSRPDKEDLAETAIFAYTMLRYPGRLDPATEDWVRTHIPNRLGYITENLFSSFVSSTEEANLSSTIKTMEVFPNPVKGEVAIKLGSIVQYSNILIYDKLGRIVKTQKAKEGENLVALDELPSAAYTIRVEGYKAVKVVKE